MDPADLISKELPKNSPSLPHQRPFSSLFNWLKPTKTQSKNPSVPVSHQVSDEKHVIKTSPPSPSSDSIKSSKPFTLSDISLEIPRGSLTAIVGPVGSGKSSILQALMGDMKQIKGQPARFGGTIGYCSQSAWIQNHTIRDNICFGLRFDQDRYQAVIRSSCLESDLSSFPYGDQTIIGERGINLSGGQKQRVSIARGLYCDPDIILLDDPLSAVDAHVGNHLFEHAIRNTSARTNPIPQTRILVTHALHFLPRVDHIICLHQGQITETGNFQDLMNAKGLFYELVRDFGGGPRPGPPDPPTIEPPITTHPLQSSQSIKPSPDPNLIYTNLQIQEEEKSTGAVGWSGKNLFHLFQSPFFLSSN